ncbi:DDE-type integrase/transposase/recombinase [Streptomyces sp. NPDC090499]|uniref:DDE-type integrase/transposase/recombinase n=1 Tax=Streptomyces sp. NPDC090499 TaxID=3365965 RepID=UPI00381437FA
MTDARWCGDITYIPTDEGWLYLATVIDIASRSVVGWATADHCAPNWSPTPCEPPATSAAPRGRAGVASTG